MKKSRKIFLSFGSGIIASSLVLVSAITVANKENWNDHQRTASEELKTFIESQTKGDTSSWSKISQWIKKLYVPDKYKTRRGYKEIIDFAIDENQLQSVYDFFIQLPSFNQINDENSKNEWIKQIKNWFWERFNLYDIPYNENKKGSIEWRFMPNKAVTDEDHAAENAIDVFDQKIKDLTTFKTLNEYVGRFNTFEQFKSFVLNELQKELKKEVYNAPRAYYNDFVTRVKNATIDPNDSNNLNRNIPQDLSETLLNWLKNSQNLNKDEKARGGSYDNALELLGDNGLIGINKKIAQIREKLATYQAKKSSFDYKFEPDEPEKTDFDNEKEKLTIQLQELQEKLKGLNAAIEGKIEQPGWNTKKQQILDLTTTNQNLATGLNTYIAAEEKLEGLLKYKEKVTELKKILSDSSLSSEKKKHYNDRIDSLGKDAKNYSELQNIGNQIKNSIEADSNVEKIINKFSLWTNEQQKDPYREQIKRVYKDPALNDQAKNAKIKEIKQQIFSKMKQNANNLIDQTSLGNTEKETYKNLINSENIDENNNPYDLPLIKAITKAKIDNLDALNPAQKVSFKNKIDEQNADNDTKINQILTESEAVNQKMNDYKNTFKDDTNSDETNVETIKKSTDYTGADNDKKTAFDTALNQRSTDLSSQTDNLTIQQINQKIAALKQAKDELNGDEKRSDLHSKIEQLTHLSEAQKEDLKDLVDAANSKADSQTIYEKGKLLNDKIGEFKEKITEAESAKATEAYTEDTTANQGTFDSALTNAKSELATLQGESLSSLNASAIETKATEVATKTTTLNDAIEDLDGYRNKIKKSLNNWEYLTPEQVKDLQEQVDSKSKEPTDDEVNAILSEGFGWSKETAKTKITSDIYPNLSTSEINTYKGSIDSGSITKITDQKYDKELKDIVNQAAQDNKTKQDAIDAINTLDTLTQYQKNIFINSVKDEAAASASKHQNDATALNNAIKDLKNVVLEKVKDLADDDTLAHTNMFDAAKTDKKYRLADTDKQTAYDNKLTQIQTAVSKSNVQKSEIEGLKQPFLDAFNALNGVDNETRLHNQIDALSKLTLDEKTNLKKLVSAANSLTDAKVIVAKATTLNDAITTLEAKIAKAKEVKGQPIYIGEDNKTPFDDALSGAESALSTLKSDNLESSSAVDLQSKATDLSAKETALQSAIDNLDGIRKQFKKDLAQKWILLDESDKNALIDKVDT
ncbi:GA module-containing protein, partial [Mycoplasmopsis pullorum]|uniref:GA module-containing protein n=1 Tax=Mycoplasmopsis pullorum TaxID=48003 RepID=UPI001117D445